MSNVVATGFCVCLLLIGKSVVYKQFVIGTQTELKLNFYFKKVEGRFFLQKVILGNENLITVQLAAQL